MATLDQTLRCIGQDLERFPTAIRDLKIEAFDNSYNVQVTVNIPVKRSVEKTVRRRTDRTKTGLDVDSKGTIATRSFQLRYNLKDIDYLEREGFAKRRSPRGTPDFLSLSHILRMAGAQVEKRSGQLVGVWRSVQAEGTQSLVLRFKSRNGEERKEEYAGPTIYDLCVRWYKRRNGRTAKVANL
jgi:hypothetical protein